MSAKVTFDSYNLVFKSMHLAIIGLQEVIYLFDIIRVKVGFYTFSKYMLFLILTTK